MSKLDIQDLVYLSSANQLLERFSSNPLPDAWKAEIIDAIRNGSREDLEQAFPDICPDAIREGQETRRYHAVEEFVFDHPAQDTMKKAGLAPSGDWELAIMTAISHGKRPDLEAAYPEYARPVK